MANRAIGDGGIFPYALNREKYLRPQLTLPQLTAPTQREAPPRGRVGAAPEEEGLSGENYFHSPGVTSVSGLVSGLAR